MIQRSVAAALFLLTTLAAAGSPCDGLLDRPPRDPHSSECLRSYVEPTLGARLEAWLADSPGDPWLLAAAGGQFVDVNGSRARPALAKALESFVALGEARGEAYVRLLLARDFQRRRLVEDVRREMVAAQSLGPTADDPVLQTWLALLESGELSFESRDEEALFVLRKVGLAEWFPALPEGLRREVLHQLAAEAVLTGRLSEALAFANRTAAVCGDAPACLELEAHQIALITNELAEAGLTTPADAEQRARQAHEAARTPWTEVTSLCMVAKWTSPPESLEWNRLCAERAPADCPDLRFFAQLRRAEAAAADRTEVDRSIRTVEQMAREQRRHPLGASPDLADTLSVLAQLHKRAGDRASAIRALEEAIGFREKVRDRQADGDSRASVVSRSARYYYDLAWYLALAGGDADVARAFATMEALRARTLLDELHATGSPQLGGPDADELARTVEAITAVQEHLADPALPEAQRDEALGRLERLELHEEELASRIARANPAWGQQWRPRLAELGDVRRQLGDDEALVMLQLVVREVSEAWALVVASDRVRVVRLADLDMGSALPLYLGAIERREALPQAMTQALETALLAPVLESLPPSVRRLVIVPDGPLARLPLAALPDPPGGRPLVERFELILVPSATAWLALRGSGAQRLAPAVLGLGDVPRERSTGREDVARGSDFAAHLLELPHSGHEIRSVIETVGGQSRGLYGTGASEAALKRYDLVPFGIVHFATHAVVNTLHPARSAVLLAAGAEGEDGLLQPREIAALELAGKLVVLSACRSAGGRELRGEGPLSLARAFLGAGARAVLGTIWPVRDTEAAVLAERFYAHLALGETAATSLAAAQRELLAAGAPPAAWAGFVLIGDGGAKLTPGPPRRALSAGRLVVGAAAITALAAVLVWRHRRT